MSHLQRDKTLNIIKYNKKLHEKLNININDYKDYSEIEIEIEPTEDKYGKFINIPHKKDKGHFHIFFNDNYNEEINRIYLVINEKINKIIIIIKSFNNLFKDCNCIESVYFKKCNRKNIKDIHHMFSGCKTLKKINFNNFNAENIINMSSLFFYCESLKEIDFPKFRTKKIKIMFFMFCGCSSLKEINLSNFNYENIEFIQSLFSDCFSLKKSKSG